MSSDPTDQLPSQTGGTGTGVAPIPAGSTFGDNPSIDSSVVNKLRELIQEVFDLKEDVARLQQETTHLKKRTQRADHQILMAGVNIVGPTSWPWYTMPQITADQNDYHLEFEESINFRLESDAARVITGIEAPVWGGEHLRVRNFGAFNITFNDKDGASAAANQIITGTGAPIVMAPEESLTFSYDDVTAMWSIIS